MRIIFNQGRLDRQNPSGNRQQEWALRLCAVMQHLRIALLLGSTRTEGPPFPANVGLRVGRFIADAVRSRGHEIHIINPISEEHALPLLRKPQFAYKTGTAPPPLDELAGVLYVLQMRTLRLQ